MVIWSDFDPRNMELEDLARAATSGDCYCSEVQETIVHEPENDPQWDGTEFFDFDDEGEVTSG